MDFGECAFFKMGWVPACLPSLGCLHLKKLLPRLDIVHINQHHCCFDGSFIYTQG